MKTTIWTFIEARNGPFEGFFSDVEVKRPSWENFAQDSAIEGERRCVLRCSPGVYQGAKRLLAGAFHSAINPHKTKDRHASKRGAMQACHVRRDRLCRSDAEASFARDLAAPLGEFVL